MNPNTTPGGVSFAEAEAEADSKEEALTLAFEELGVDPDAWTDQTFQGIQETAVEELGIELEDITVQILSEGAQGLVGLGGNLPSRPARVRVSIERREEILPEDILDQIVYLMGIDAEIYVDDRDDETHLTLETPDAAILIGRHGRTLDALQYLVNGMIRRVSSDSERRRIVVNAGQYREKREDMLIEMAHQLARRARATGREVELEPMSPRDRRTVHLALSDDEDVRTFSRNVGQGRAVVVAPRDRYVPDS